MVDNPPVKDKIGPWDVNVIIKGRFRKGCDVCKDVKAPTEKFIGWNLHELWICRICLRKLMKW